MADKGDGSGGGFSGRQCSFVILFFGLAFILCLNDIHAYNHRVHIHSQHKHILLPYSLTFPTCVYDNSLNLTGSLSNAEVTLHNTIFEVFHRAPSMAERIAYYNNLKSGEINGTELKVYLKSLVDDSSKGINAISSEKSVTPTEVHIKSDEYLRLSGWDSNIISWSTYRPSAVYIWTLDLHPSPAACNIPIYSQINAILHPEIDHKPFCDFYGVCPQRLEPSAFSLGKFMSGFSLDPDYKIAKTNFMNHYRKSEEFKRIDIFMCSHPAANCEIFEEFLNLEERPKKLVLFFTTRLEFGRNDMNIGWRQRTVSKWNAWSELELRQREWIQFVVK